MSNSASPVDEAELSSLTASIASFISKHQQHATSCVFSLNDLGEDLDPSSHILAKSIIQGCGKKNNSVKNATIQQINQPI